MRSLDFIQKFKIPPLHSAANQRGFTIMEVLVAAAIFLLGFAFLVHLTDRIIYRDSYDDNIMALSLASKHLERVIVSDSLLTGDIAVEGDDVSYTVTGEVNSEGKLVCMRIYIKRTRIDKNLIQLYVEKIIH